MTGVGRPRTLSQAAEELRAGRVTSVELLAEATAPADTHDARLGVYIERFDETAAQAAARADADFAAGLDAGPLQGIPISVKDIIATREGPTTAQSLVLDREWGAGRDAVAVERLRRAGAVITGKTTTMEFAAGLPDPDRAFPLPRNPWDAERWSGGSSSGAAIGAAAGMFLAGLGTDTGGSIRIPASWCGVTGLVPTYGRVPTAGTVPLAWTLDHIGPIARSARDCALVLGAIAGPDERDPVAAREPVPELLALAGGSLDGVRIGVARAGHLGVLDDEDPAVGPAFEAAVAALGERGAELSEVSLPYQLEVSTAVFVAMVAEAAAYHHGDLRDRLADYAPGNRPLFLLGSLFSAADYVQAQRVRRAAQRALAEVFATVDAIVTPTATRAAPTYETVLSQPLLPTLRGVNTGYWNGVGCPVLVAPMGFDGNGLPLSLQIAARPYHEDVVIAVGDAYQQATDWHLRVPAELG